MGTQYGHDLASVYASEYLKSKSKDATSFDDQAAAYEKLMGNAYDPLSDHFQAGFGKKLSTDKNADLDAYRNLFTQEHARGGLGKIGEPTGKYVLKADTRKLGWGPQKTNAELEQELHQRLMGSAYEDALMKNLFTQNKVLDEKKLKELGDAGISDKTGDQNYWVQLHNNLTGEDTFTKDYDEDTESNFYRKYKDNIIRTGGGIAGGIIGSIVPGVGTVYGAMVGQQLAGSARDAYKARAIRRKVLDARRDWENEQAAEEAAYAAAHNANLFKSAGEGVVDWNTSDVDKNKRRDTYVREAT